MHGHNEIAGKNQEKWDRWFLGLAQYVSTASKDPSTKTGAVITRKDRSIASVGFNGLPRRVVDSSERLDNREVKYKMIVHCERNAIIFARQDLKDCTLYTWPFMSCAPCAGMVVQSGITRVVYPKPTEEQLSRWGEDFCLSKEIFHEGWVETTEYE